MLACGVLAAWRLRRPLLCGLLIVAFTAVQTGAARSATVSVVDAGAVDTRLELATDPEPTSGGVRAMVRLDGKLLEARAWGSPAGHLRPRLAGEWVDAMVTVRPLTDPPAWLLAQGVVGRATITSVTGFGEGHLASRIANSLRRTIEAGAASLPPDLRSLFTGLVYGDDRNQSPLVGDAFDGAGLSHLLAVSGQNVAFVLALLWPFLRRLGHRSRFAAILVVLLVFATMTRFEPSVTRASVMAAIAASGSMLGAEVSSKRILSLAVIGLAAVRPTLVDQVAFQLSVAASAGILLWSARFALALPGPRPLAEAMGVTASAQLAVAPLLLWRFGSMPVAALPANLLAGIAAGPTMMWGMTGGVVAGLVPDAVAAVLHLPTRVTVGWINVVAEFSATLPLGELQAAHLVIVAVGVGAAVCSLGTRRRIAALVVTAALAAPAAAAAFATPRSQTLDRGSHLWTDGHTVVVELDGASRPQNVLGALRRSGVDDIDLVVARSTSFATAQLLTWIRVRHEVDLVWAASTDLGHGEVVPTANDRIIVGGAALGVLLDDGDVDLVRVRD